MVAQRVRNPKQFGLTFANHDKFRKHQRSDPDIKHLYKVIRHPFMVFKHPFMVDHFEW